MKRCEKCGVVPNHYLSEAAYVLKDGHTYCPHCANSNKKKRIESDTTVYELIAYCLVVIGSIIGISLLLSIY